MQEDGVPIFIVLLASAVIIGAFILTAVIIGVFLSASIGG